MVVACFHKTRRVSFSSPSASRNEQHEKCDGEIELTYDEEDESLREKKSSHVTQAVVTIRKWALNYEDVSASILWKHAVHTPAIIPDHVPYDMKLWPDDGIRLD